MDELVIENATWNCYQLILPYLKQYDYILMMASGDKNYLNLSQKKTLKLTKAKLIFTV